MNGLPDWRFMGMVVGDEENRSHEFRTLIFNRMMSEPCIIFCSGNQLFPQRDGTCFTDCCAVIFGWTRIVLVLLSQEHWDSCDEAGPQKRTATPFEQAVPTLKVLAKEEGTMKFLACRLRVQRFKTIACPRDRSFLVYKVLFNHPVVTNSGSLYQMRSRNLWGQRRPSF